MLPSSSHVAFVAIWFVLCAASFLLPDCDGNSDSSKDDPAVVARAHECNATIYGTTDAESRHFDGKGSAARFASPRGLAIDSKGTLYVADFEVVRKITSDGVVTTLAGIPGHQGCSDGHGDKASFYMLNAIAVDRNDAIYVVDGGTNKIRRISPTGEVSTLATRFPDTIQERLTGHPPSLEGTTPQGIVVAADGSMYVTVIDAVLRVRADGLESVFAGNPLRFPLDTRKSREEKSEIDGPSDVARFHFAQGIAIDKGGKLYVTDFEADTVRAIDQNGTVRTLAGAPGGLHEAQGHHADGVGSAARFFAPMGITASDSGLVYVADRNNHCIRKITPDGSVSTLAGFPGQPGSRDGAGSEARFILPTAIAVGKQGDLFVTDVTDETVRRIRPDGTVTTFAGSSQFLMRHEGRAK